MNRVKFLETVPFILLIAACSISVGCDEGPGEEVKTIDNNGHGIIGGEESKWAEEWRGVVGLGFPGMSMCSGTLIDPRVVLSAGHCVSGSGFDMSAFPNLLSIIGGAKAGRTLGRAKKIVVHPSWSGDVEAEATDLSLILLQNPVADDIPWYKFRDFPMPEVGSSAFLVGYGDDGTGSSGTQMMGDTTILEVTPGLIQIGGAGMATTCPGDSGGPVFIKQNDQWTLIGVNSFGAGTVCDPEVGMYSVNTLSACHWLNKTMIDLVGHDLGLEQCTLCQAEPACIWGHGCGPDLPDCPYGTECVKPKEFSSGGYGYCAAPCCELGSADEELCYDVSEGEEKCDIRGDNGQAFCVTYCDDDSDCPKSTMCENRPFSDVKICIATKDSAADGIDTDTMDCPEPEPEEDAGAEESTDAGADADADADADTDTDADVDNGSDAGEDDNEATGGCGCRLTGIPATVRVNTFGSLFLLAVIP
ncbi:MAG: S1 family peptidase [Deltaproteobacteria bacterium]|nr:S1 family peptidase [Deltaproteobacteria bacterium]